MKLNKLSVYFGLSSIFMTFLVSCTETSSDYINQSAEVNFVGSVLENKEIVSRAPMSSYINWKKFETTFYIEMQTEGIPYRGTYHVDELTDGILRSHDNEQPLNWHSPYNKHSFYAWTMPWVDRDTYLDNPEDESEISFLQDGDMYKGLETFIGAKNGPLIYDNNGEDVPLQFQHLVSKIRFAQINYVYVKDDGSIETLGVNGKIQFINMPSKGKFTRIGSNRPTVEGDYSSTPAEYSISASSSIYVCPDVDFSQVEFRITAKPSNVEESPDFGSVGDFIGDFKLVKFERDENDWWDIARPSPTTLYAGEEMTLKMTLVRGGGVFVKVDISNWSTGLVREGTTYPYQGLFNSSDLTIFYNTFIDGNNYNDETEKQMFEIYGEYDEDGNPEYRLYDDITTNQRRIPMGKNYWLNGMGHTLTFTHPTPYSGDSYGGTRCYGIPRAKDIYITDSEGYMLYIDNDFKVWIVNEDGSMKAAVDENGQQYELTPLTGNNKRYYIDIITGKVTQTTTA